MNHLRKTHPMVLIAAIALTIFSVVGSAAITGLIPSAPSTTVQKHTVPMAEEPDATARQEQSPKENNDQYYKKTLRTPARTLVMVQA